MTFRFSYTYTDSRFGYDIEIEASDYETAKAQLVSAKGESVKVTAVQVVKGEDVTL